MPLNESSTAPGEAADIEPEVVERDRDAANRHRDRLVRDRDAERTVQVRGASPSR